MRAGAMMRECVRLIDGHGWQTASSDRASESGEPLVGASRHERAGLREWIGEFVATFGLLLVITGRARWRPGSVALAVGAYITSAYWFTPSTSFANRVVTAARAITDTFTGIRLAAAPAFVVARLAGASAAVLTSRWLFRETKEAE